MPRKPCYWTRKLELDLVEYVRKREYIWRPIGNTNHHIQQKYKAYAEFAGRLGRGFTARSVRDRWVNIRSTFNHNVRRVEKSKETAKSPADIFEPCWPLWRSLQFLREIGKRVDSNCENYQTLHDDIGEESNNFGVKEELYLENENFENDNMEIGLRQRGQRTDRPRTKNKVTPRFTYRNRCKQVIDELLSALKPMNTPTETAPDQTHWFFGKHVVERLRSMRAIDAKCAANEIFKLLENYQQNLS